MPLVWQNPDGSLRVYTFNENFLATHRREGETTADAVLRLGEEHVRVRIPSLADATPHLVKAADMPTDHANRHAWRLDGARVVPDPAIPAPPRRLSLEEQVDALRAEVRALRLAVAPIAPAIE